MSRYAVYKLFGDSKAPGNLASSGGYLKGVLSGVYDENPLYMCPPSYMCPQRPDALQCRVQNEFSPRINVNVRPQAKEGDVMDAGASDGRQRWTRACARCTGREGGDGDDTD